MKTMQLDNKIVRVDEDKVEKKVSEGWKFVAKSLWKEKVRDVKKESVVNKDTDEVEMVTTKSNKMSKSAKRHMRKTNR